MLRDFRVDLLSFALGFAAATLFWWLVSRLRPLMPRLWDGIRKRIRSIRQKNLEGVDLLLRKETLRRAQKGHLASRMFALDEILIAPRLLAPPAHNEPDTPAAHESIADQIIPYLPDWPELAAGHQAATISLSDALQNGCSIAVIGQPGSGKSVMLASLASLLARRDTGTGVLQDRLPIYLHIHALSTALPESGDPLPALIKAVGQNISPIYHKQLSRLVVDRLHNGQSLIILDGMDELHPEEISQAVGYLSALKQKFPLLQVAASASPYFLDGLIPLGLVPLGIAAWSSLQREEFIKRWSTAWNTYLTPEIERQRLNPISPLLIDNWLSGERGFVSPLEWTLKVWGAYSGDLQPVPFAAFATFFSRLSWNLTQSSAMSALAQEFIRRGLSAIPYGELEKFLTSLTPSTAVFIEPSVQAYETENIAAPKVQKGSKGKRDLILSFGEELLEKLVKAGILVEYQASLISFTNPVFAGYLAGREAKAEFVTTALRQPYWAYANQALRFSAALNQDSAWIEPFLTSEATPLERPLLLAARWLADGSPKAAWRGLVFRQLLAGLQNGKLPLSMRARMVAAFANSNDETAAKLFKQLCTSTDPNIRLLSALGLGAWADPGMTNELLALLQDPEEEVRAAACLGLVALHSENSLNAVADVLMNGDENMRQAAAETLAFLPGQGGDILREAVQAQDLLTRRAAVFGLLQIRQPWSKQLLQKTAVEDGQWVVRNAAAQALDVLNEKDPRIPVPLPPPHASSWLTAFAGKRNLGLSPEQPATDVLLMALKSGTFDDQIEALRYLISLPDERTIPAVYERYYGDQPVLQDAAVLVIWQWLISSVKLPPPPQSRS